MTGARSGPDIREQGAMTIRPINSILKVTSLLTVLIILLVSCNNATPESVPQSALPGGLSQKAHEAVINRLLDP